MASQWGVIAIPENRVNPAREGLEVGYNLGYQQLTHLANHPSGQKKPARYGYLECLLMTLKGWSQVPKERVGSTSEGSWTLQVLLIRLEACHLDALQLGSFLVSRCAPADPTRAVLHGAPEPREPTRLAQPQRKRGNMVRPM